MENAAAANHAEGTEKSYLLVHTIVLAVSIIVGLDVAQVSDMANFVVRAGMSVLVRIEVGARREASIRQVAVLVDVEAVQLARVQSLEGARDVGPREGISLFEQHDTLSCLVRLRIHYADGSSGFNRRLLHVAHFSAEAGALLLPVPLRGKHGHSEGEAAELLL